MRHRPHRRERHPGCAPFRSFGGHTAHTGKSPCFFVEGSFRFVKNMSIQLVRESERVEIELDNVAIAALRDSAPASPAGHLLVPRTHRASRIHVVRTTHSSIPALISSLLSSSSSSLYIYCIRSLLLLLLSISRRLCAMLACVC